METPTPNPTDLALPILKDLVPGGFGYGTVIAVEFDSKSLWYEMSLTVAANALKAGIRTDYHTFQHIPTEVRMSIEKLGVDVQGAERNGAFSIIDSYTVQLGMGAPQVPSDRLLFQTQSVKLSDWSIQAAREMKSGAREAEKRRLHIDDATSVLLQYNDEKLFIDSWRTRWIPISRVRELAFLNSLVTGVYSESLYRMFESLCDGIIEIKSEEIGKSVEHLIRVRALRGTRCDSRWHRLRSLENGEIALAD